MMATAGIILREERLVFRAVLYDSWVKRGRVTYKAFRLRGPTTEYPAPESELSLGLTPEGAVKELNEYIGTARLVVGEIQALPHGLTVRQQDEDTAALFGLPLHSTDAAQIDMAITVATDLANIVREFTPAEESIAKDNQG